MYGPDPPLEMAMAQYPVVGSIKSRNIISAGLIQNSTPDMTIAKLGGTASQGAKYEPH